MKPRVILIPMLALALLAAACGSDDAGDAPTTTAADSTTTTTTTEADPEPPSPISGFAGSDLDRVDPEAPADDVLAAAAANREFAADLYAALAAGNDNLVFSPTSIHLALAMAYAGADGDTAAEMAEVLHLPFEGDRLHAALNALDALIESRNLEEPPGPDDLERKVEVNTANALWGQHGFEFLAEFLDTLAANYGAGMNLVDYVNAAEQARRDINAWVAEQTNDKITDLIPEGLLGPMVRLVLTNAVYLDATWMVPFDPEATIDGPFTRLDDSTVTAEMMHAEHFTLYGSGDGWQAIDLPYVGNQLSMLILVPDEGRFGEIEDLVPAGLFDDALDALEAGVVRLGLPKFEYRTEAGIAGVLRQLGMPSAFDPNTADFSRMTVAERLFISDVIHKAYIAVDEAGTEAAAATAIVMRATAAPIDVVELEIDRPFLYSLYDRETGTVLFLGRVLDPTEG